jgi:hypothetical protein
MAMAQEKMDFLFWPFAECVLKTDVKAVEKSTFLVHKSRCETATGNQTGEILRIII